MRILTRQYSRYFIAILLMTVLYGKSVVCIKSVVWKSQYASTEDYGDTASADSENETETSAKPCKKSFVEMETGQFLLLTTPLLSNPADLLAWHHPSSPSRLYQKVPTQPPLLPLA